MEGIKDISRPVLPKDMVNKLAAAAKWINSIRDTNLRLFYVANMAYENARLLEEVNQYRAAAGVPLLPVYDPMVKGK